MKGRVEGLLDRLASVGALPADDAEARLRKSLLILIVVLLGIVVLSIWSVFYWVLDLRLAASIPFTFQVFSVLSLVYLASTKDFETFRNVELFMALTLPVSLQWALGGFAASGAVMLWAAWPAIGQVMFQSRRQSVPWFLGFLGLLVLSVALDRQFAARPPSLSPGVASAFFGLNVAVVIGSMYLALGYFADQRDQAMRALDREHHLLQREQEQSERLLLSILPKPVADGLKENPRAIASRYDDVTVVFADIVDFTRISSGLGPEALVRWLNEFFTALDRLTERCGLEKIKTVGDAYMAVAGAPAPHPDPAGAAAEFALGIREEAAARAAPNGEPLRLRIGMHSGPVVAGVIGTRKFSYDLWGDTVNVASRMESHGVPNAIQVSAATCERLRGRYAFGERQRIDVKGKGLMTTYMLLGRMERTREPV